MGLGLRLGSSFLLNPTHNTSPKPHPSKNIAMWAFMSYLGLRTWDPFEVVNPTFHALSG
jgi:hypothetical protein